MRKTISSNRLSTGIPELDEKIGGGLVPGTMTVLVGSSGIGKTQFGVKFANAGFAQNSQSCSADQEVAAQEVKAKKTSKNELRRGVILDLIARADSQGHSEYAKRLCDWTIRTEEPGKKFDPETFFESAKSVGDYFRVIASRGSRITKRDLEFDAWHDFQAKQAKHLSETIAFVFSHLVSGADRIVIDGIEPVDHQSDSMQFEILEYIYHQVIQKEPDWVARDLFRQHYRNYSEKIAENLYDQKKICTLVLYTSPETSLENMIEKPLQS
ncbi:MAG: RAD55 family ATPase, partial [Thermoguttaceae bacterium]